MPLKKLVETAVSARYEKRKQWPTYDGKFLERSDFMSASEAGSCLRSTFFSKHTEKYPASLDDDWGYFERGHNVEQWITDQLLTLDPAVYKFHFIGKEQRSFYDNDSGLSGTPDGIIEWLQETGKSGTRKTLIEIKSIDPRKDKARLPARKHVLQAEQNCALVEDCLGWKIDDYVIHYRDASNYQDCVDFHFPYEGKHLNELLDRVDLLWAAKNPDQLPAEGVLTGDCEHCRFTKHCSAIVKADKRMEVARKVAVSFSGDLVLIDRTEDELGSIAAEFVQSHQIAKEAAEVLENDKALLKQYMVDLKADEVVVDGFRVSLKLLPGRTSFDRALLKEALGEAITDFEKTGAPFLQVNVSKERD